MRAKTVVLVLRCCLFVTVTASAHAQSLVSSSRSTASLPVSSVKMERPSLSGAFLRGGGSIQPGLGYRPGFVFGGGVDYRFRRLQLLSDFSADTARKTGINSGFSVKAGAGLYLLKDDFGFGGGARCGKLRTSAYEKGSCRPFVGAIYNHPQIRFDIAYYFPGTDKVNRLQGMRTVTLFPFSKHAAFELEFGVYRFTNSFGSTPYTGASFSPGFRYYF